MDIWIIADTHFNHSVMLEKNYRLERYEHLIADSFKRINDSADILIHLGDICMGRDEEMHELYIKPYRFKKILVRGNHDHRSDNWYLNHGWDFVVSTFSARYFGCDLIFSHRPMGEVPEGHLNIHGHLHDGHRDGYSSWAKDSFKHKLVALELQGYEAINLRRFLNV